MKESPRRLAREVVLKALYAVEHGDVDPAKALDDLLKEVKLSKKNILFVRSLFELTLKNQNWADEHITRLAENWHLNRIAAIDKTILRMGMVELDQLLDTPLKVAINEAIELAKKFSSADSSKFVNGILDKFVKESTDLSPKKAPR